MVKGFSVSCSLYSVCAFPPQRSPSYRLHVLYISLDTTQLFFQKYFVFKTGLAVYSLACCTWPASFACLIYARKGGLPFKLPSYTCWLQPILFNPCDIPSDLDVWSHNHLLLVLLSKRMNCAVKILHNTEFTNLSHENDFCLLHLKELATQVEILNLALKNYLTLFPHSCLVTYPLS